MADVAGVAAGVAVGVVAQKSKAMIVKMIRTSKRSITLTCDFLIWSVYTPVDGRIKKKNCVAVLALPVTHDSRGEAVDMPWQEFEFLESNPDFLLINRHVVDALITRVEKP